MSRTIFPFAVGDICALARKLNTEIGARDA
jgi:hypothetical protein